LHFEEPERFAERFATDGVFLEHVGLRGQGIAWLPSLTDDVSNEITGDRLGPLGWAGEPVARGDRDRTVSGWVGAVR
jgi:hypothetical protein